VSSVSAVLERTGVLRRIAALVFTVGLVGLSVGSASSLAVRGGTLQAGADVGLTCDPGGVRVHYGLTFASGEYRVSSVEVTGFANSCIGKVVEVHLTAGGTDIGSATGTVMLSGPSNNRTTGSMAVGTPPPAADVDDVHVLVVDNAA
jgi:hypothetical protein